MDIQVGHIVAGDLLSDRLLVRRVSAGHDHLRQQRGIATVEEWQASAAGVVEPSLQGIGAGGQGRGHDQPVAGDDVAPGPGAGGLCRPDVALSDQCAAGESSCTKTA